MPSQPTMTNFLRRLRPAEKRVAKRSPQTPLNTTFMPKLKHLTEYHKKALELKYKGNPYREIAETLNSQFEKSRKAGFTEQTIKDWFKESGTLCETYKLYEREMDEIHRETMHAIKKAGA